MTLPRGSEALRLLLAELPARIPPREIDRAWVFAPREVAGKESGLVVLSLLDADDPASEQRRLVTVTYEAERAGGRRRTDTVTEQGRAPAARIPGLIEGVLRRLEKERPEQDPYEEALAGDPERWSALVARFAGQPG